MSDSLSETRNLFTRHHRKPDGRSLWVYGRALHNEPPAQEIAGYQAGGAHLRFHPLRQEWLVVSPGRQARTFDPAGALNPLLPFRDGAPLTEIPFTDFELAVFENRFPGLSSNAIPAPVSTWQTGTASGACEVIVYSTNPEASMGSLPDDRRVLLLEAISDRMRHHAALGAQFVLPFENRGAEAGVTLHHPHGQIYAFPFVPSPQATAARAFAGGYSLQRELDLWGDTAIVHARAHAVGFVPPFARFPYECWLAPTARRHSLTTLEAAELDDMAALIGDICCRYDRLFGRPMPYMMTLHSAPAGAEARFHFTVQFYPLLRSAERLKFLAGVEQATGVFTVDVVPEAAAAALRAA